MNGVKHYKRGGTAFVMALLAACAVLLVQGVVMLSFPDPFSVEALAFAEFVPGLFAMLMLLALGARNILLPRADRFRQTLRASILVIVIAAVLMCIDVPAYFAEGYEVSPDWPVRMLLVLILCVGTGLFEEGVFRGMIFGGLMALLGKTRAGIMAAAVISALIFGAAHIVPDGSITAYTAADVAQMVLKTLEAGMLGFFLAAMLLTTRSMWGIAAVHALNNFLLMVFPIGLFNDSLATEYVVQGEETMAVIILYAVMVALYTPLVVKGVNMIRALELPEYGPIPTRKGTAAEEARGRGGALTDEQVQERLRAYAQMAGGWAGGPAGGGWAGGPAGGYGGAYWQGNAAPAPGAPTPGPAYGVPQQMPVQQQVPVQQPYAAPQQTAYNQPAASPQQMPAQQPYAEPQQPAAAPAQQDSPQHERPQQNSYWKGTLE